MRIGETRVPLDARNAALRTGETNVGNFVTDVMRARLRADVAIMNGGGIRGNQMVPAGALTRRDINALLPFLNVLVMLEVPGKVLLDVLERSVAVYPREFGGFLQVSGLSFVFDPARPPGQRVVRVLVGGQPLDPERRYTAGDQQLHGRRAATATRCWPRRSPSCSPRTAPAWRRRSSRPSSAPASIAAGTEGRITRTQPLRRHGA